MELKCEWILTESKIYGFYLYFFVFVSFLVWFFNANWLCFVDKILCNQSNWRFYFEKKSQTETRQRQYGLNHSTLLLIPLSVSLSLCSMQFKLVPTHFDARLKIISQFTCTIIMRTWVNAIYISHINISQAHDRNGWEHKAMRAKAWALLKFERNISIICWNDLPLRIWGNTLCKSHGGMRFESIVFS